MFVRYYFNIMVSSFMKIDLLTCIVGLVNIAPCIVADFLSLLLLLVVHQAYVALHVHNARLRCKRKRLADNSFERKW